MKWGRQTGLAEKGTWGKPRDRGVTWLFGGEEHSRQRKWQHAEALSQKPAGGDLSKKIEGQEGAEASGIRPAFFKVILITVRIQGGQEWKPRDQEPGSFHREVLTESLKQRQAHFNRYLPVDCRLRGTSQQTQWDFSARAAKGIASLMKGRRKQRTSGRAWRWETDISLYHFTPTQWGGRKQK